MQLRIYKKLQELNLEKKQLLIEYVIGEYLAKDIGVVPFQYFCPNCGEVPVPEEQLPIILPDDISFNKPGNPLENHPTWKNTNCPKCNQSYKRNRYF